MRVGLLAALLAAAFFSGAARAEIKMGVGAPITGSDAAFGAQLKNGAEQAVADINAAGGILGQKVTLEVGDDAADAKQGRSVANQFIGDGVSFVIGHFNSSVTMPASDAYNEAGVLEITPGSTNPQITERGIPMLFRTCGRDDQQGAVAAAYLIAHAKGKRIAIIHDKSTYGKGLADETRKRLHAAGVQEVLYEGLNPGEKDYSSIVSKIKSVDADIVFFGGVHTEGGLLVRQMRDQGVEATLMGGDGIASQEFAAIAGPGVVGTLMTFPPDPRLRPEAAAVVKEFEARHYNPETYTLYSYAAVQVIAQAIEKAKSTDPTAVAKVLHDDGPFKTVVGDLSFDAKGDVKRADYVVYQWRKGPDGKITYFQLDK
ncbi:branched-chain amino acid ABC transporter substrate-binding protein [Rhodoblastus acidophilus]|uniref:Branched-chain amino acid ABC transporter substrate-binding protein n=1 Tax=Candidatus Rhodoblastus alkanivorans TaxID=2954117 RepID=A0ABS9Z6K1_9HYPH|nr:branched-chain amino acid ABC transporter substrate-binding protein [Candidatus Rhodoblastus alkanivorans]MCI4678667.1 branched-chain amino acid ABC transporter substrate-binding protein [Candidatus Rhodoblastus alkanivorans]MCI4683076.1 branched-chain amino acid ABC transporter substrate-binding protein [Candidatus Rhodoblastus alkanivorans]MDI4640387.1 branched-chain amino acid ABC transporter substrate-binding protein [Rhodoblastus acidophilus]